MPKNKENLMIALKTLGFLAIFIGINYLYLRIFGMIVNPAGITGTITAITSLASVGYVIAWFLTAAFAGMKNENSLLYAGLIFSVLPLIGYLAGLLFMGTPLAILVMIPFFWAVPFQGLGIEFGFMVIQFPLCLAGYEIGKRRLSKYKRDI